MIDFENSTDCFPVLHIDSGVCYFLWDREYNGMIDYILKTIDGLILKSNRYLKNDYFDYVVRDNRRFSIIEKSSKEQRFSKIVSSRKPFGIETDFFNALERYSNSNFSNEPFENSLKIYGVKGLKGGARRVIGYISPDFVTTNKDKVNQYKLFFSKSYSTNAINPPEIIIGKPHSVCTSTFLMIGSFLYEKEMKNCIEYMNTNFFKTLLFFGKGTMNVTKSVFDLIPLQDFSEPWTDEKLYKKYELNQEEIDFIESMIRPMEINNNEEEVEHE